MGRRRKVIRWIGVMFFLVILFSGHRTAQAKYYANSHIVEQARGKAPDLRVYLTGKDSSEKSTFYGKLDGTIDLDQNGETAVFEKTGEGVNYIILLDNSASVDEAQFKEVKKQLAAMRQNMKEHDQMSLYLVGTKSASGNKSSVFRKTAAGNAKKEIKKNQKEISKIKRDSGKKSKTVLYRSLNEILAEHAAPQMRTVVLLLTDGEDDSAGKSNSKESTLKNVREALIPVYCIMMNNVAKKPNRSKIKNTFRIMEEKNSRGYCADCSGSSSRKKIKKGFAAIRDIVYKKTLVVDLKASDNIPVEGVAKFQLTARKGNKAVPVTVTSGADYSGSVPDTQPPVLGEIVKVNGNAISFTVTDDSGAVEGADQAANYIVKTKQEEEDGKVWNISGVSYNSVDQTAVITFAEELYTGEYTLTCSNIRDASREHNTINQSYDFHFEGLDEQMEKRKEFVRSYWWIAVILLVLIVCVIVIIMIKRKPPKVVEINADELIKADSRQIRLTITDRKGAIKDVEWNVEGSLFIGRSDINNIYFDDDRLSKQHFVIEVTKMACYIEDLESTNGTFVNGVRMGTRRMLLDGDVITAGREKFVFHIIKTDENETEKEGL